MADFWRVERAALDGRAADLAHFEFAVWRGAVTQVLDALPAGGTLTELGRRFVAGMAAQAAAWADEPVPGRPRSVARAEEHDLRAVWRGRHLRPDPGPVRETAAAWRRGADPKEAPPVPSRLRPDSGPGSPDARSELRRVLLAEPGALAERAAEGTGTARPAALAAADVALLHGAADDAVRGYLDVLARHPASASAWAGLGLALRDTGESTAADALLHRPELVRAVTAELRTGPGAPPDPVAVADWIGRSGAVDEEP